MRPSTAGIYSDLAQTGAPCLGASPLPLNHMLSLSDDDRARELLLDRLSADPAQQRTSAACANSISTERASQQVMRMN